MHREFLRPMLASGRRCLTSERKKAVEAWLLPRLETRWMGAAPRSVMLQSNITGLVGSVERRCPARSRCISPAFAAAPQCSKELMIGAIDAPFPKDL